MSTQRAIVCPHCGRLHEPGLPTCPITRKPLTAPTGAAQLVVPRGQRPTQGQTERRRALIGRTIDSKYRVRSVIGEGGMGSVFEAEQMSIGRLVAIKVLHPAQAKKQVAVKRFHQEARAVGSIGHPNICEVYDMGALEDGSPYIVLERLTGHTLSARLSADGRVPWQEAIDIFTQVASGLVAAHERGILHRDIKPENVFLSQRPGCPAIVKLLDFGVSKIVATAPRGDDFDEETLTKTGMVMGTPYYMAPEQARGERDLDGRLDVYACGVVMYEILAGRRPFTGANYNSLLLAILTSNPPTLRSLEPRVPAPLERVVAKAMARRREDRYATAGELREALLEAGRIGDAAPSGQSTPQVAPKKRRESAISVEIPVSFIDSDEVQELYEDQTTTARSAPRLPEDDDAYADSSGDRTELMTPEEIARRVRTSVPDTDQQAASPPLDEDTAKMNAEDVEVVRQALREARDAERKRKR